MDNCCPSHNGSLATDDVCGNFSFACGSSDFLIWDTSEVIPIGTLSVFYRQGCADALTVTVTDSNGMTDMFDVSPENTRSRTYANLVSVHLTCSSGSGANKCEGSYCLDLHYFVEND